ncbi:MAG: pirin family protein [Planctomycetota bacterium]
MTTANTLVLRRHAERGRSNFGWLDSRHTFSFGDYHDPAHMGFRSLRVINDDRVAGGGGFGKHPHRNMEILSYVVDGALAHSDSLGTGSVIRPGELQRMTAGTGVTHSEFNDSKTDPVRFLQIWIVPAQRGIEPSYEQRAFPLDDRRGEFVLVASNDGRDGSITVHQDVRLYAGRFNDGDSTSIALESGRAAWIQIVRGAMTVNGQPLAEGDGAAVSDELRIEFAARVDRTEVLVIDLA